MNDEADGTDEGADLTERFERGEQIADEHGLTDPLLAYALQDALDTVDAGQDIREGAFNLAALPAVEAHANGKSPVLVAAAIVYDTSVANGGDYRQVDIARAIGQSREALSQHCQKLRLALNTDAPATAEGS